MSWFHRLEDWIGRNAGLLWVISEVGFVIALIFWVMHHGSIH